MSVKLPSIPAVRGRDITPALSRILGPMKTILENLIVERNNLLYAIQKVDAAAQIQDEIYDGGLDVSQSSDDPTKPSSLTTASDIRGVELLWVHRGYSNHELAEIYRSDSASRTAGAKIGETAGNTYVDTTAVNGVTYYYWVRNKSSYGKYSSFDTGDAAGTTGGGTDIVLTEFGVGLHPVELHATLPVADLTDGRTAYIPDDALYCYDLTNTRWDKFEKNKTTQNFNSATGATVSGTATATDIVSSTIDVGAVGSKLTTVLVTVSCMLESATDVVTALDLVIDYNGGTAVQTDSGYYVKDGFFGGPLVYNRTVGITVGAETGSITVKLTGLRTGTENIAVTDAWITLQGR